VLALRAAGAPRRLRVVAEIAFAAVVVLSSGVLVAEAIVGRDLFALFDSDRPSPVWLVFAVVSPIAVARRLLSHATVSTGTILGAIAGFLLTALAFFYLELLVAGAQDGPFFAGHEGDTRTPLFMYFSLVSITTTGYGDLAARTDLGRFVASTECVVGQVYLVVFLALLVGLYVADRRRG
jgi:Ion channel